MAATTPRVVEFPDKLGFLFRPARYKVAYGGRGGTKSWGFARALLLLAAERRLRILCTRQLQLSITDSVHKLLADQTIALGLEHTYQVQRTTIRGVNGSEFIFSGLQANVTKIKSKEGVDIVWVEEAEKVTEESWRVLIPTIRKAGSEIWVSFNPDEENDPTYQRFVVHPPPGAVVVPIGWQDNPWFPEELRREKDYDYRIDPEAAEHVWEGKTRTISDAQVLRGRWVVDVFDPSPEWGGPYYGADWGFAQDPSAFVRCWVRPADEERGPELYIDHEAYGVGVDTVKLPELFDTVPGGREHVSRADSARPETISHMQQHGYPRMVGAVKGPGSVEDGVEHLRSYSRIVIHPRCKHAAEEARLWSFKRDRLTGEIKPELVDAHNHVWDGVRYALEPIIRSSGTGFVAFAQAQLEARRKAEAKAKAKAKAGS